MQDTRKVLNSQIPNSGTTTEKKIKNGFQGSVVDSKKQLPILSSSDDAFLPKPYFGMTVKQLKIAGLITISIVGVFGYLYFKGKK